MPDQTPNLQLPLPLGNETVNRQFFLDLINAIDTGAISEEQLEEAISEIAIAMVDEFTSTDKTKAPTADALRRGLETKQNTIRLADNYLAASVLVNAAPDAQGRSYPDGLSFFKVSSSAGGWPTANGYVVTMRAGSGGFQMYFEMYTGATQTDKTSRFWYRSKRDANTFWQDWSRTLTEADRALITTWANSVADTRTTNAVPNAYAQGVTREFKIGSSVGLSGEGFLLLATNKPWTDSSGGRAFQEAYGGTTGAKYLRFSNDAGNAWEGWQPIITGAYPWQKHKLTTDDGLGQNISNQNLNDYRRGGTYLGENLANAPTTGAGQWYIVEVQSMDPSATTGYVKQVAKSIFSNSYRERTCAAGTWSAWSEDLFTSVVNGKNDVKNAVVAKSGIVSQVGSVPTFTELVAGINTIVTKKYARLDYGTLGTGASRTASLGFTPEIVSITGVNSGDNLVALIKMRALQGQDILRSEISNGSGFFANITGAPPTTFTFGVYATSSAISSVIVEAWG